MNRRSLLKLVAAVVPASWLPMPRVAPVAKEWSQVVREAVPGYLEQEAADNAALVERYAQLVPRMAKRMHERFAEEMYLGTATGDRLLGIESFVRVEQPNYGSD